MIKIFEFVLCIILASFFVVSPANGQLEEQGVALTKIADFADRMCAKSSLEGGSTNLELSGSAKVELNKFLKNLFAGGVKGAGKFLDSKYENVLQKDLAAHIGDVSKCKLRIFESLNDKLISPVESLKPTESLWTRCSEGQEADACRTVHTSLRGECSPLFAANVSDPNSCNANRVLRCNRYTQAVRGLIESLNGGDMDNFHRTKGNIKGMLNAGQNENCGYVPDLLSKG